MKLLVNIDVPELNAAIDFYCSALPLRLNRILDEDVAELVGASSLVYLLCQGGDKKPVRGLARSRTYERHWTPVHVDFVVVDIELAAQRAMDAGAVRESDCIEWMGSKCTFQTHLVMDFV